MPRIPLAAAGYEVAGEHYKRVPAGLDPDLPRAGLLRYGGLYAFPPAGFGRPAVSSPSLADAWPPKKSRSNSRVGLVSWSAP